MPWLAEVAAVVDMYVSGQEGGRAVADVLTGAVNPSGKLPFTMPRRLEDTPAFTNSTAPGLREVLYGEGIFVGYRWYDAKGIEPLFPFGHGLSYTSFEYGDLRMPADVPAGGTVTVTAAVRNTGPRAGAEVVQLYVADTASSLPRPPRELKGFVKVGLSPGQSRIVSFTLDARSLSFYDPARRDWIAEPGDFHVFLGSSSRDIRLRGSFNYGTD
jgi:beta-glucosidase